MVQGCRRRHPAKWFRTNHHAETRRRGPSMPCKPKKAPGGKERSSPFPDRQALAASLRSAWSTGEPVVVLRRQRTVYERTFPSEVVTCRLPDGSRRRLLCKYSAGPGHRDGGRRGGGTYEAEVYRRALRG